MKKGFSAALICRKNEEGKIEFLIVPSYRVKVSQDGKRKRFGKLLYKFPGGKSHTNVKESPWKTCRRETKEETGLIIYQGAALDPIEIDLGHFQNYFLVYISSVKGKLRTRMKRDNNSDLFPPIWMKEGELLEAMLFPTHRKAYHLFKGAGLV